MVKLFSHSFYTITGKYHEQSAILLMSVNLTVIRITIVVRIPVSGNRKNPRFLRFLGQVGTRLNQMKLFLTSEIPRDIFGTTMKVY